jgi:hypothetical protein
MAVKIQKSSDLGEIWFPSRFWCWELISMVWESYYDPLCRNLHRSMWQLLGGWKKIQNGGRCHGNQGIKWPPKYKNPPIWAKFGFQVDFDVGNWYPSLVCYGARNWMKFSRIFVW